MTDPLFKARPPARVPGFYEGAEAAVMPFGEHKGRCLGAIVADGDSGLLYLDWLAGIEIKAAWLKQAVTEVCEKYSAEIDRAVGD